MTEPEYEDRQADLRREAERRGLDRLRAGRDARTDGYAAERADERQPPSREWDRQDRTQWTRPALDHNTNAARSRELSGDDWRLADLKYNEADQWRATRPTWPPPRITSRGSAMTAPRPAQGHSTLTDRL